jgi:hypothetical protein
LGPPGSGSFHLYHPEHLQVLVVDPLGRKVGSENGQDINEIIGASYGVEKINSPSDGTTSSLSGYLHIPDPAEGFYQVNVTSEITSKELIEIYRHNRNENPQSLISKELMLQADTPIVFYVPYSTKDGDLNGDGFVNESDLRIILESLNTQHGGPGFNPIADINNDSFIDFVDYEAVLKEVPNADLDSDGVLDSNDSCLGSNTSSPLLIGTCNTGVENDVFDNGCTLSDELNKCTYEIRNHGDYVSCVANLLNNLKKEKFISGKEKGSILDCVAQSDVK